MSNYRRHWIPEKEYRKRKRAMNKRREETLAREAEEKRQKELAWAERGQKLTRAKEEHPIAYFFGNTDAQQEIFGKVSIENRVFGLGKRSDDNPTGHTGVVGHIVNFLVLVAFSPLLLLSHIHNFPVLQIVAFVVLGIETKRYKQGVAHKHERKISLAALTFIGWVQFFTVMELPMWIPLSLTTASHR